MRHAILGALLLPLPALAQEVDCANAMTQSAMNICAGQDYERADAALNAAYQAAIAAAREADSYGDDLSYEDLLREAQRLWVPFRDAACEAEAPLQGSTGGSMAPMLHAYCLVRLTEDRTRDLEAYAEQRAM